MWLFGLTLVILKYNVLTYNLDVNNAKVFNNPTNFNHKRGSYFGFSVALYANKEDSVLLIGAPRANTSTIQDAIEPGTVYQCPINDTCKEWNVDKTGNSQRKRKPNVNQFKNNAWIGATIAVESTTDPRIVICGPLWKSIDDKLKNSMYMNGICYWTVVKNVKTFDSEAEHKILPLTDFSKQIINRHYNFGMGQTGFSLHMTSNESRWILILGSPGVLEWKGTSILVTKSLHDEIQTIIPAITREVGLRSFNYFGYSVTSGCYFKQGELWFASGAPRAENMYGKVIIFQYPNGKNKPLIVKKIVSGEQPGEYFGAALTSCDLNGDGKDELIVGAPQWAKDIDEGRIYVFTTSHNEIVEKQSFDGEIPGSRFGSVITCLGDIDYDGYADFAVGAPYEEQTGAIYIFNGNSNGLLKLYSQKIMGRQFGENVCGFGISISEPCDINGDKYSDIAVGAYLSEQAILIKSKPVVTITTKLTYIDKEKLLQNSTFFQINVCTSYDAKNVPTHLRIVEIVKIDEVYGRAFYGIVKSDDNIYKFSDTLYKSKILCRELTLNLKENIQNVIDPLEISVSVILDEDIQHKNKEINPHVLYTSYAVINKYLSKTKDLIKLPFVIDCGKDNICISDVNIELSIDRFDNRFTIGSKSAVKFIIDAFNYGEPAYEAKIYVYIPEILSLASMPLSCMESSHMHNTLEVICDIENPLRKNKTLVLELDMSKVQFDIDHVELWTNFTMQSDKIRNSFNNTHALSIYFDIDADIVIAGKAKDDLYSYFHKDGEQQLDSLQFEHMYEVQKFGVSPIEEVTLAISIPTYWKDSTEDIPIIIINKTIGHMDGQQFYCTHLNFTPSMSLINKSKNQVTNSDLNTQRKFTVETNSLINLPPENRSVYINCSNINIKCTYIKCELGPFTDFSSIARLSLTLDLHLLNFNSNLIEGKDIIFFLSNGSVNIVQPYNISQKLGQKPDSTIVATMFLGSPITKPTATWIIVVSIALGIVFLMFLIFILIAIGFFNRKKKQELKALQFETSKKHENILETNSSKKIFNQEID